MNQKNKEEDQLAFSLIEFKTKKEMISFLNKNQYSKPRIKKLIEEKK